MTFLVMALVEVLIAISTKLRLLRGKVWLTSSNRALQQLLVSTLLSPQELVLARYLQAHTTFKEQV